MPKSVRRQQLRPTAAELRAATERTFATSSHPGSTSCSAGSTRDLFRRHRLPLRSPGQSILAALHAAGFTPRRFAPSEGRGLIELGYGITNLVARTTATAAELSPDELRHGRKRLEQATKRYRPRVIAIVGITAYRAAFDRPDAVLGRQSERLIDSIVWVLPNTSGLNAHHQAPDFARAFGELRTAVRRLAHASR